jgi:hypothetical protein
LLPMAIISGNFRTGNSGSPGTPDGGAYNYVKFNNYITKK